MCVFTLGRPGELCSKTVTGSGEATAACSDGKDENGLEVTVSHHTSGAMALHGDQVAT